MMIWRYWQGVLLTPQPIHQNVDESPRARFPTRIGIAVADSDQRAQQVGRIDILAHIAAGNRALHEGGDRACNQFHGICSRGGPATSPRCPPWPDYAFSGVVVHEH